MHRSVQILLLMLLSGQIYAQTERIASIDVIDPAGQVVQEREIKYSDTLKLKDRVNDLLYKYYNQGYLLASFNVAAGEGGSAYIKLFTGEQFEMLRLGKGNVDELLLNKSGYSRKDFKGEPFSFRHISKLFAGVLNYAENNGYPFATIKLDSISLGINTIEASLNYNRGPKFVFDTLVINGASKTNVNWLIAYLKIFPGQLYNDKAFRDIVDNINMLPYLSVTRQPEVLFKGGKATITIYLEETKVNNIDGIIGLLPNQQEGEKLLITGRLDLELYHIFGTGKEIKLYWEKLNTNTQDFNASYYHPNFLKMPLGFGTEFFLHKQDTSFLNRNFRLFADFIPATRQRLAFETEFRRSRVIDIDVEPGDLPAVNNVDVNYYGLDYNVNKLDDLFIPRRGWKGNVSAGIGDRSIIKNPELDDSVYDGIELKSIQYMVELVWDNYLALNRNMVIRSRITGGLVHSDQLFVNDLFQVGGFNSIRGFNQNYFFTDQYVYGNFEYRLIAEDGTYFFAFYDQGYVRNSVLSLPIDYPIGLGVGINFTTNTGMFNFVFAMGKSNNQQMEFNQSKIHFGYTGRF